MVTTTAPGTGMTVVQYIQQTGEVDPSTALQIACAELEKAKADAAIAAADARSMAEVTYGPGGVITKITLGGMWRLAQMFAGSDLVPAHFRKKPNDCCIGVQMAIRCGVEPFMFLQSCYVINGKPGIESKLAIAMLNSSGRVRGRVGFKLEGSGKTRSCRASAKDALTGQGVTADVNMEMAAREGWVSKSGSKWLTLPDLMLQYRSAMFLIRLNYPEVLMGMQSKEELDDITIDAGPALPSPAADGSQPPAALDELTKTLEAGQPPVNAAPPAQTVVAEKPVDEAATQNDYPPELTEYAAALASAPNVDEAGLAYHDFVEMTELLENDKLVEIALSMRDEAKARLTPAKQETFA